MIKVEVKAVEVVPPPQEVTITMSMDVAQRLMGCLDWKEAAAAQPNSLYSQLLRAGVIASSYPSYALGSDLVKFYVGVTP